MVYARLIRRTTTRTTIRTVSKLSGTHRRLSVKGPKNLKIWLIFAAGQLLKVVRLIFERILQVNLKNGEISQPDRQGTPLGGTPAVSSEMRPGSCPAWVVQHDPKNSAELVELGFPTPTF